jgi:hypothetical protein
MTGNPEIFFKSSPDGGETWTEVGQLTNSSDADTSPSITQTEDGTIWLAWHSDRTGNSEIYYKTCSGPSWSGDQRLTQSNDVDSEPTILGTLDGTVWIFWTLWDPPGGTDDIYYKYSTDDGATWSSSIQFTTHGSDDTWPTATQTTDVKIWVVWTSMRTGNSDLFYRRSLPGDITGPGGDPDGVVDLNDLTMVSESYGRVQGDLQYVPDADLNKDDIIDVRDLAVVASEYGET